MNKIKINKNHPKYYYPCCKEENCDGILSIKINENGRSLNYQCDNNYNHKGENIYFKTFERFYLKEKQIPKCSKCDIILENVIKCKCKKCNSFYCIPCSYFHEHIKKNLNEICVINENKCAIHEKDFTSYCKNCIKYLCHFCIKEHNNHEVIILNEIIPSKNSIDQIKNEIKIKVNKFSEIYENYFNLLDE